MEFYNTESDSFVVYEEFPTMKLALFVKRFNLPWTVNIPEYYLEKDVVAAKLEHNWIQLSTGELLFGTINVCTTLRLCRDLTDIVLFFNRVICITKKGRVYRVSQNMIGTYLMYHCTCSTANVKKYEIHPNGILIMLTVDHVLYQVIGAELHEIPNNHSQIISIFTGNGGIGVFFKDDTGMGGYRMLTQEMQIDDVFHPANIEFIGGARIKSARKIVHCM